MWKKIFNLKVSKADLYQGAKKEALERALNNLMQLRVEIEKPLDFRFEQMKKSKDFFGIRGSNSYLMVNGRFKYLKFFRILARLTWFLKTRVIHLIPEIKKNLFVELQKFKEGKQLTDFEIENNKKRASIVIKFLKEFYDILKKFKAHSSYDFCDQKVVEFCYRVDNEQIDTILKFYIYKHTIFPFFYDLYFETKFHTEEESLGGEFYLEEIGRFSDEVQAFYMQLSEMGKPEFISEFLDVVGLGLCNEPGAIIFLQDADRPNRREDEREFRDTHRLQTYWYTLLIKEPPDRAFSINNYYFLDQILKKIVFFYDDLEKFCHFYQEIKDLDNLLNAIFLAEFYDDSSKAINEILCIQKYDLDPIFKIDLVDFSFISDTFEQKCALNGIFIYENKRPVLFPLWSLIDYFNNLFGWDFFEKHKNVFVKKKMLDLELKLKYNLNFNELFELFEDDLKIFLKQGYKFYEKNVVEIDNLIFSQIHLIPNAFDDIDELYLGKSIDFEPETRIDLPGKQSFSRREITSKFFGDGLRRIYLNGQIEKEYKDFYYIRTRYWVEKFLQKTGEIKDSDDFCYGIDEDNYKTNFVKDKISNQKFLEKKEEYRVLSKVPKGFEDFYLFKNAIKEEKKKNEEEDKSVFSNSEGAEILENLEEEIEIKEEEKLFKKKELYSKFYNAILNYYKLQDRMTFTEKKKYFLEKASLEGYFDMVRMLSYPTTPEFVKWLDQYQKEFQIVFDGKSK